MKKMLFFATSIFLAGTSCAQTHSSRSVFDVEDWLAASKSIIIPGWGQIGKGHVTEGVITLTAEVIVAGGAAATYFWGESVAQKMRNDGGNITTHTAHHNQYKKLTTANHVLLGTAAALWLFNIYRAFVVEPAQRSTAYIAPGLISIPEATLPAIGFAFNL